jgi:hypothetical protein
MIGSMFESICLQVSNLFVQPDSYASSEGKANRRGTGTTERFQTWIESEGESSVFGK